LAQYSFERLRAEYQRLWSQMEVTKTQGATAQAKKVIQNKARYKEVEKATTVPWFVVGCLHMRESSGNFNTYLGNGQPLNMVTTIVPKGRGPFDSFLDGAIDALQLEGLDKITDWGPEHVAYAAEKFNGFGYRHPSRNIPSPYLWGGTNVQKPGKFVSDGVYDPSVMDTQIGAMAVLKTIMALDVEARFKASPVPPAVPTVNPGPTLSPKATDEETKIKPIAKSKTFWGGLLQGVSGLVTAVVAFIQGMPPWLIAFLAGAILLGLYMVIKGRIDVQAIIKHLSDDDTGDEA